MTTTQTTHTATDTPTDTRTMEAPDLVHATTEAWNRGDREAYVALYAEDCEITAPGSTGTGHAAVEDLWASTMTAFPDNQVRVLRVIGSGGSAVEESVIEGTHSGPLTGPDGEQVPATGRRVSVQLAMVHEARGGRLVASRLYYDQLELLGQLGLLPG